MSDEAAFGFSERRRFTRWILTGSGAFWWRDNYQVSVLSILHHRKHLHTVLKIYSGVVVVTAPCLQQWHHSLLHWLVRKTNPSLTYVENLFVFTLTQVFFAQMAWYLITWCGDDQARVSIVCRRWYISVFLYKAVTFRIFGVQGNT